MTIDGKGCGGGGGESHSEGNTLYVTADSTVVGAKVDFAGQAGLSGDYPMQAKMTLSGLDIEQATGDRCAGAVGGDIVDWRSGHGEWSAEDAEDVEWSERRSTTSI